ncbi:MAG: glutamate synthase large subunit, partial [Campylobacterales bacterium]|nr:glutamate synthase large subunit [Campylobacterales bacterium]
MRDLFTSFKDNCGFGLLASIDNTPSHKNLEDAITALSRMMHRGAIAADGKSGDGSGLLLSLPKKFFTKEAKKEGIVLPNMYAVAMLFYQNEKHIETIKDICLNNDLKVFYKRDVPIDTEALGVQALETLPKIAQLFVMPNSLIGTRRFDALVYLSRKEIERALHDDKDFYIPSFSTSVISYKGLVMPTHIKEFYQDLANPNFEISFCLFHQRFSTNTLPKWKLAQPFRMIAHNGEINSVTANRFNVKAKSEDMKSDIFSDEELLRLENIIQEGMSDSASVDNFFEFLNVNGVDFFKAARSMFPAPWQNAPHMDADLRAFYEYTSTCFEPWDGPAAVSMTDGRYIGCVLDRNGLRPAKYIITSDRRILIASEYGVLDIADEDIVERGRLQSGEMIGLDLKYGKVLKSKDIDNYLKNAEPYGQWLNENMSYLQEHLDTPFNTVYDLDEKILQAKQRYFNITHEVLDQVIEPMMKEGKEATGSMGDDTPLAAFSSKQRNFSDFFKQKFAQVTNPPIDPIREKVVMSLNSGFGETRNILNDDSHHAKRLKTTTPILSAENLEVIKDFGDINDPKYEKYYKAKTYATTFSSDLKASLDKLAQEIINDVKDNGVRTIILDDRTLLEEKIMPMLMVAGYVNQQLLEQKVRHLATIIVISGEVCDAHTAAALIAFGTAAIYPYMLYKSVAHILRRQNKEQEISTVLKKVRKAMGSGLLKIMSKMGISTISSYRNSKLFDIIGLDKKLVNECFKGAKVLLSGLGYDDIEERINKAHAQAYHKDNAQRIYPLNIGGFYKYLEGEEYHDYAPSTVHAIHAVAISGKTEDFERLKSLIDTRDKKFIRDFFHLKSDRSPIDIEEVEPLEAIFKRFVTAAMSLGSIS